jgi:hypothetical protein
MRSTPINPTELFRIVYLFDILVAVVFAVSGALVAWVSVITGVGGETVRDLILESEVSERIVITRRRSERHYPDS